MSIVARTAAGKRVLKLAYTAYAYDASINHANQSGFFAILLPRPAIAAETGRRFAGKYDNFSASRGNLSPKPAYAHKTVRAYAKHLCIRELRL
jgi:hypothetical protein